MCHRATTTKRVNGNFVCRETKRRRKGRIGVVTYAAYRSRWDATFRYGTTYFSEKKGKVYITFLFFSFLFFFNFFPPIVSRVKLSIIKLKSAFHTLDETFSFFFFLFSFFPRRTLFLRTEGKIRDVSSARVALFRNDRLEKISRDPLFQSPRDPNYAA